MSVKIIQERLENYRAASWQEEELALKEILQELALAGLSRTDFFKHAAFQGGTALRILYGTERFSEDLDFILKTPDSSFHLISFLKALEEELKVYGISVEIKDRSHADRTVQKAFLKEDSDGRELILQFYPRAQPPKKIRIKFEVDTNPPLGSQLETKYLDFPFASAILTQNPPSLFAGKSHALLCREYLKGRDWYDFVWYVGRKTQINYTFLTNACKQQGSWKGQDLQVTKEWILKEVTKKIESIDWEEAKKDVARFLRPAALKSLEVWSREFFLDRVEKLKDYLL